MLNNEDKKDSTGTSRLTCAFIIRMHYEENDRRFEWRLKYFKDAVLPRLRAQTDKDFDICVRCNPIHDGIFLELGCKPFHVKKEYSDYFLSADGQQKFFFDFVKWEDCINLEQYDIQIGLDSDDLIASDYVERVKFECTGSKTSLHIFFQPEEYVLKTKKIRPHPELFRDGSPFLALYYPDKSEYHHCYETSHRRLARLATRSILIPSGYCWLSIHDQNESTGRIFKPDELKGIKPFSQKPYPDDAKKINQAPDIKCLGNVYWLFLSCSSDENIRFHASSGGFIKSFLKYLLESAEIDYAIVTRTGDSSRPLTPETIITSSVDDILSTRTNSIYAPTDPLRILDRLDPSKKYAFVGLPCQVRNLKTQQQRGKYRNIITLISLFCKCTPDIRFTGNILKTLDIKAEDIQQIEYRGNGWPGGFTAHLKNGQKKYLSLEKYWPSVFNNVPKKYRRCSDMGKEADICVGDPWNLGLEKTDGKGMSLVICRNRNTRRLIESAADANIIKIQDCSREDLIQSQGSHIEEKLAGGNRRKGLFRSFLSKAGFK